MPSTPTTKSQVQAYRFVLRRMQSALVRKDAVMLHDPMRTHSRATIVGVCLAALGLLGFLIWGILSPKPTVPSKDGIVVGKPSGQVYVLVTEPTKQLIPVFNLASARLLLYARSLGDEDPNQQVGGPGSGGSTQVQAPTFVDDNELRDQIPRTRKVGIVDGPDLLPSKDQRIDSTWTVCDQYILAKQENDSAREDIVETSVLAGVNDLGPELETNKALLVRAPNEDVFLVYRTPTSANLPNTSAVRAKVDLEQGSVVAALGLDETQIRNITTGLLNAIPEKAALTTPVIDNLDEQPNYEIPPEVNQIGSVFSVQPTGQQPQFWVVLPDGIEQISKTAGDLIRYYRDPGGGDVPQLSPEVISNTDRISAEEDKIDDTTFPTQPPAVLRPDTFPVACLGWRVAGQGENRIVKTSLHVSDAIPGVKRNAEGNPDWVDVSTPGSTGIRIDHFYMPPGRGGVVRQATSPESFETGPITLVSDRGVKYGVPNKATADVLGLDNPLPAPDGILVLLPDGASLDAKDVEQSYDSVPAGSGEYPSESPDEEGASGQSGGG